MTIQLTSVRGFASRFIQENGVLFVHERRFGCNSPYFW